MPVSAHDGLRREIWDGVSVSMLPEVDPTDDSAAELQKVSQPERRLLFAILADAIVRCRRLATAARYATIELREAERWIRSDDREWPCSFVNVCEALDIEWQPLRRVVLGWRRSSDRTSLTRRALLVRNKTRKRSAAAVPACASAGGADSGAAASASSASEKPETSGSERGASASSDERLARAYVASCQPSLGCGPDAAMTVARLALA